MNTKYIHGTTPSEQERLAKLNALTNDAYLVFLDIQPEFRVLEVGSGLGILAGEAARRAHRGYVVGIEYSPQQLAKVQLCTDNIGFVRGDAHRLPLIDNQFDLVYCRYLLEHVADPLQVAREAYRVLKPGGRFCVQENNVEVNTFWPDRPTWNFVWEQFTRLQTMLGGDALVGKKLFPILKDAGFARVELSIQPEVHWADSPYYQTWIENMMGVAETGREEMLARKLVTRAQMDKAVEELRELIANPEGTAMFYWNRATGWKQG